MTYQINITPMQPCRFQITLVCVNSRVLMKGKDMIGARRATQILDNVILPAQTNINYSLMLER